MKDFFYWENGHKKFVLFNESNYLIENLYETVSRL